MNGWISTEVALPIDSADIIDFRWSENPSKARRIYAWGIMNADGSSNDIRGYWRYLDTPEQEKRDSGHPDAIARHSDAWSDQLKQQLLREVRLVNERTAQLEEACGQINVLVARLGERLSQIATNCHNGSAQAW